MRKITYFDNHEELADSGMWVDLFFNHMNDKEWLKLITNKIAIFDIINTFAPKKTKILHTAYFKDIASCEDERLLTLLAHLYFELFLDQIIRAKITHPANILEYNFKSKLDILYATNIIDQQMYEEISFLNKTRNGFAHKLNYNLEIFDYKKSPTLSKYYSRNPYKKNKNRKFFLMTLYRLLLMQIGLQIGREHKEIYLLDTTMV